MYLRNLIDNAIKYRETSRKLNVLLYGFADGDTVTYCVEDNGKGIEKEYYEKIFQLFARLDPESAKGRVSGLRS